MEHVPLGKVYQMINSLDSQGNTPLHHAACEGNVEAVSALLGYGADFNIVNSSGDTPLTCVVRLGMEETWVPEDGEILHPQVFRSPVFKCLIHHIERFYAIGYHVDQLNLQYIRAMGIQDRCLNEIRDMEFYQIAGMKYTPLDLFFLSDEPFLRVMRNRAIIAELFNNTFSKRFRSYAFCLKYRVKLLKVHFDRYRNIVRAIHEDLGLPVLCAERIADFLL